MALSSAQTAPNSCARAPAYWSRQHNHLSGPVHHRLASRIRSARQAVPSTHPERQLTDACAAGAVPRRLILGMGGLTAASELLHLKPAWGAGGSSPDDAAAAPPRVRPNVESLSPAQLESLAKGVGKMKSRDPGDPTSWLFQANIHGAVNNNGPAFNKCQHHNLFFFAWHRGYLWHFERILQAAAEDPILPLPYWDWSSDSSRLLPAAYRDSASSLYHANRATGINKGVSGVPDEIAILGVRNALSQTRFALDPTAEDVGGFTGSLEGDVHDQIHGLVGGDMGRVRRSAQDPVFWAHHANVDRLWNRWLAIPGRTNGFTPAVLATRFEFFDETGAARVVTVADIIDATKGSDYRYDDDAPGSSTAVPAAPRPSAGARRAPAGPAAAPVLLATSEPLPSEVPADAAGASRSFSFEDAAPGPKSLGFATETVALVPVAPDAAGSTGGFQLPNMFSFGTSSTTRNLQGLFRLVVEVEGVSFSEPPAFSYSVLINAPDDSARLSAAEAADFYVGALSFFRSAHHSSGTGDGTTFSQSFDATEVVERLRRKGLWSDGEAPRIRLEPFGPAAVPGSEELVQKSVNDSAAAAGISYKRINLLRVPAEP